MNPINSSGPLLIRFLMPCFAHGLSVRVAELLERSVTMHFVLRTTLILTLLVTGGSVFADVVHVATAAELRQAIGSAVPGSIIEVSPGNYSGEMGFGNLHGTENLPIVIRAADPQLLPVIEGGGTGMQFSSVSHLVLRDLIFDGSQLNGINIDDGGSGQQLSHHIKLQNLVLRKIGTTGNDDAIKFSGVTDFVIENCTIDDWGLEGQCVDLTGCRDGRVTDCRFDGRETVKVGMQIKGGSHDIVVSGCSFRGITDRAMQLGGTTGPVFFRPADAKFEAKDITVVDCTFSGAEAAIAFVGVDGAVVERNIIDRPTKWVMRILQENREPHLVLCQNGVFSDNIIVWSSDGFIGPVDVGSETRSETFQFRGNYWFCEDQPRHSRPSGLPAKEQDGVYGQDPGLYFDADGNMLLLRNLEEMKAAATAEAATYARRLKQAAGIGLILLIGLSLVGSRVQLPWLDAFKRFNPRDVTFIGVRSSPPPVRIHFVVLSVGLIAAVVASSLSGMGMDATAWNLHGVFERLTQNPLGTDLNRRAEWLVTFLMFVPIGAALHAAGTIDHRKVGRVVIWAVVSLVISILVATAVEFLQVLVPNSVVSQNDILAAGMGALLGIVVWQAVGPPVVNMLRRWTRHWRPRQPTDLLLLGYTIALVGYSLWPFQFELHPVALYHRFKSGALILTPFAPATFDLQRAVIHILLFIPMGAWLSTFGTRLDQPVRRTSVCLLVGLLAAIGLELAQFFVRTRFADVTAIITGTLGCVIGSLLMAHWAIRNPLFSPVPTANRTLRRMRYVVSVLGLLAGAIVLFLSLQTL